MNTEKVSTVAAPERWYQVRLGRLLFYADPSAPGVDKRGNVWARENQFVEASHPVLQGIINLQAYKVRKLSAGEVIPAGSLIQDAKGNPYIKRLMDKHDGRQEDGGEKTPEAIVVGDGGASAPALSPEPAAPAAASPEATAPPVAAPTAPGAPPAVETASAPPASMSPSPTAVPAPAAPPPPASSGEVQTLTKDDIGTISL
jgi:hypothetical protein